MVIIKIMTKLNKMLNILKNNWRIIKMVSHIIKIPQDFAAVRDNTKTYEKHMSEIGLCPVLRSLQ